MPTERVILIRSLTSQRLWLKQPYMRLRNALISRRVVSMSSICAFLRETADSKIYNKQHVHQYNGFFTKKQSIRSRNGASLVVSCLSSSAASQYMPWS